MRTKALLIAAAAMAVGVVSSEAQVYSQNIVGYVNNVAGQNYSVQSVPFDQAGGNSLTNLISNAGGAWDGSYVYVWSGTGFTVYTLDSSLSTGLGDAADATAVTPPVLNPGTCFFVNNQTPAAITNTYVGTVHIGSGTYPGTSTNVLSATGYSLVAPVIPVGGGLTSVLGLTNSAGALDGSYVYVPHIVNGSFNGYTVSTFDSGLATGFGDAADAVAVPEPVISVGGGFFFNNQSGSAVNWVQSIGQ